MLNKFWGSLKSLFEMVEVNGEIPSMHKECPVCKGTGFEDVFITCESCEGNGYVKELQLQETV
ncbi:hypothetical protein A361_10560 [Cytobacillus oceanisediminis 2691]|uniref:Uncharacterized protein n=1 Tax=Cytobacillus oceanisediminis 2691 TaxID=1196031 RepID=A0A161IXX6_9BACI|nr:hypothetical protein A361_10560 [Cytobacillus oceanisediminis 2691]